MLKRDCVVKKIYKRMCLIGIKWKDSYLLLPILMQIN